MEGTASAVPLTSIKSGALVSPRPTRKITHAFLRTIGWLACIIYSTIPLFWLMVHPRAHRWRASERSPFRVLVPAWIVMWIGVAVITAPWRDLAFYSLPVAWIPAALLFAAGISLYSNAGAHFSWAQLGGLPEVRAGHHDDRLVTTGIRSRVRHPVYLGHLCEMLAWSVGSGLAVCWLLTAFAIVNRRSYDPHGRRRTRKALWQRIYGVSAQSPRSRAQTALMTQSWRSFSKLSL